MKGSSKMWKEDKEEIEELLRNVWSKISKMKEQYDELYSTEERYLNIVHSGIRYILTKTSEIYGPIK